MVKTKKRKGPIRVGPRHIEAGTQYTGYRGYMRREGSIYGYSRAPEGQYREKPEHNFNLPPGYTFDPITGAVRLSKGVKPSDSFNVSRNWWTDIKILATVGVVIVAFLISYVVMDTFFEVIVDLCTAIGIDSTTALSFQPVFQSALGVVVSLIILGAAVLLFFGQNETDSSNYTEEWE